MNLDALIERGRRPWLPSSRATGLDVWHEHDVPLAGTFEFEGQRILFTVVGPVATTVTMWAMCELSDGGAEPVDMLVFKDTKDMHGFLNEQFAGTRHLMILAHNYKIHRWGDREGSSDLLDDAIAFLDQVVQAEEGDRPEPRRAAMHARLETAEHVVGELIRA